MMTKIKPIYRAGEFMGFSALIRGEWTTPQPYKVLMIALRDSQK